MQKTQTDNMINRNRTTVRTSAPQSNSTSYIRMLHGSPDAPALDVYVNGEPVVTDFTYKDMTKYLPLQPGNYEITVYMAGEKTNPLINTTVSIPANSVYTLALAGRLADMSLFPIPEPIQAQDMGTACVRFIHLSPCAPSLDIKLENGTMLFENSSFKDITKYVCLAPNEYTFDLFLTGTDTNALNIPNVPLEANKFYTIYIVTIQGNPPNVESILVEEPRY